MYKYDAISFLQSDNNVARGLKATKDVMFLNGWVSACPFVCQPRREYGAKAICDKVGSTPTAGSLVGYYFSN